MIFNQEQARFYGPSDFIYDHQARCCDTISVACPVVQQVEPITFIRKYVTTKTTTTGIPPPQLVNGQFLSQQDLQRQMAQSCTQLQRDQYLMQPINTTSQTRFRCQSTQNGFQQTTGSQQGFRSASIPPPQRFDINESEINSNTMGGSNSRFYSATSRTSADQIQQPQPINHVRESKSSSHQYNSSSYVGGMQGQRSSSVTKQNNQTLPVNYSQIQHINNNIRQNNSSLGEHMTNSNSCIDYSNSHFARQNNNGIEKPIPNKPQTIPIYQQ